MSGRQTNEWHLDKRVPVALIVALVGQCLVGIWWVAGVNAAMISADQRLTRLEQSDLRQGEVFGRITVQLARIEERLIALQHGGDRAAPPINQQN